MLFIRPIMSSASPVGIASITAEPATVASMLMRVLDLVSSAEFYCHVFGCTVAVREVNAALLLAPNGFQIYLYADRSSTQRPIGALGVKEVMWATVTAEALEQVGIRMRERYPSTYLHSANGVSFVDGRDPDGNRVLVAYPSPLQLPRQIIADRFH